VSTVSKLHSFTGHEGALYALEEGPATHGIFSAGSDRIVAAWNAAQGGEAQLITRLPSAVYSLCYVKERGLLLAGTGAGSVHIIDFREKKEIKILQLHSAQVFDIRCSLQHGLFFTAGGDGQFSVCSLDALSSLAIRKLCAEKVRSIDVHPQQTEVAVASGDGYVRIFSLPDLEEKKMFRAHELSANCVKYHPQGDYLLSGGRDAHLKAWDCKADFAPIVSIPAHNFALYSIVFSPDEKLFATASRDKTIKLWDAERISFLLRIDHEKFEGHVNSVNRLLWTEDALVSAGDDRAVLVWKVE